MLPDTFAPADEILPSLTVTVELVEASQLPLFVIIVTFQMPSYGDWAKAGATALPAKRHESKMVARRSTRMNQILDFV